jgi:DNA-binding transcriptional regulator YiaG
MLPKEYETALKALGLSQVGAARLLGVAGRTSRSWVAGDREIPEPAARFLQFIIAEGYTPAEVMKALNREDEL